MVEQIIKVSVFNKEAFNVGCLYDLHFSQEEFTKRDMQLIRLTEEYLDFIKFSASTNEVVDMEYIFVEDVMNKRVIITKR